MSERVFVDTSAYYALTDRSDANHASAVAKAQQFSLEGVDLFTSNYVVAETHTLILNRRGTISPSRFWSISMLALRGLSVPPRPMSVAAGKSSSTTMIKSTLL